MFTDEESPTIKNVPHNIDHSTDPGSISAVVSWTEPTANDNSGFVTSSSSHKPGDSFSIGDTTVTYSAIDPYFNEISQSFTVTVKGKLKI